MFAWKQRRKIFTLLVMFVGATGTGHVIGFRCVVIILTFIYCISIAACSVSYVIPTNFPDETMDSSEANGPSGREMDVFIG